MKLKRDVLRIAMDTARARGRDYAYVPLADLTALLDESEELERMREAIRALAGCGMPAYAEIAAIWFPEHADAYRVFLAATEAAYEEPTP